MNVTPFEFVTTRDDDPKHTQRRCEAGDCLYLYEVHVPALHLRLCRFCLARLRATLKIAEAGLPEEGEAGGYA